jgi:hypothetical protein
VPNPKGKLNLLSTPLHHLLQEVEEMKDREKAQQ